MKVLEVPKLNRSQQKLLFLFGVTTIYLAIAAWLDFLQGPIWWDEGPFWQSSLVFSDNLIPSLEELKNYHSLNTPLPFMIFGAIEYLFQSGMFGGRVFNLILSLGIVYMIGWPSRGKSGRALLCLIGLFMCPYFLWLSGRLYTEMIACTWVLLGLITYLKGRHLLSGLAFILAISSRQYMLAFPAAIATYEFLAIVMDYHHRQTLDWQRHQRWIFPLIACFSYLGWVYLFQGLAPESAIIGKAPEVQKSVWSLKPGGAINFLSFVGAYIVIPELILFPVANPRQAFHQNKWRWLAIAASLFVFCFIFPPPVTGNGNVVKLAKLLPAYWLQFTLYYGLALLACIRFFKPNLLFFMLIFNALIMMKALPWDRYILPFVVIFWYLKSIRFEEYSMNDEKVPCITKRYYSCRSSD